MHEFHIVCCVRFRSERGDVTNFYMCVGLLQLNLFPLLQQRTTNPGFNVSLGKRPICIFYFMTHDYSPASPVFPLWILFERVTESVGDCLANVNHTALPPASYIPSASLRGGELFSRVSFWNPLPSFRGTNVMFAYCRDFNLCLTKPKVLRQWHHLSSSRCVYLKWVNVRDIINVCRFRSWMLTWYIHVF